ncbi:MAG: proline--tRNA ligase [Candidatus Firestonebacteria bacterium]
MKWSQALIPTLKDAPSEAEIASHKLMLRAGYIKKVASGIYTLMPLGLKVLLKVVNIIRAEMNRAGAEELLMPILSPAELWLETGRWELYGKEMMRVHDRQERKFALGPTHEEVITDLARSELKSYRDLPKNFYQIQIKFRDEIRPRFGLMRAREFMMKDAYSFDRDEAAAEITYGKMFEAYTNIFTRCGLKFRAVEAESGNIGGSFSHEFMVLAETGEETIIHCEKCGSAANKERAGGSCSFEGNAAEPERPLEKVSTPGMKTIEAVTGFMKVKAQELVKTLIYIIDGAPVAVLVKGDDEVNEHRLKRNLNASEVFLADAKQVEKYTGAPVGFAGPVGLKDVAIVADSSLKKMKNFAAGANEKDAHYKNVNLGRDFKADKFADLRFVSEGDLCSCGCKLSSQKGIEVGHTFKLGTKYSSKMKAEFLDEAGKLQPAIMGCYGIGVTRILAAAVEQGNDENGIIWPAEIAPYQAVITAINYADAAVKETADRLYGALLAEGVEVLLDDRDMSAGFKFKDAELIGIPFRVTVGSRGLKENSLEINIRKTKENIKVPVDGAVAKLKELLNVK